MVKEYLNNTVEFVIEKLEEILEEFYQDYRRVKKGEGKSKNKSAKNYQFELSSEHYQEVIDDLKALYGMNQKFMRKNEDISIGWRIKILSQLYQEVKYRPELMQT